MDPVGLTAVGVVLAAGAAVGLWRRRTDGRLRAPSESRLRTSGEGNLRASGEGLLRASSEGNLRASGEGLLRASSGGRLRASGGGRDVSEGTMPAGVEPGQTGGVGEPVEKLDPALLERLGVEPGRVTLLQFSTAFCAPCRAVRRVSGEVATLLPEIRHVEVDAESHLDEVRELNIWRTPTLLILDTDGHVTRRATGVPTKPHLIAALAELLPA